ncbi:penicillin-binding protein 2, partial [Candidatus Dependentiae bacterium]|nr:penicillin-binding protein 2 [Candidatus Dependentiae bacterium]
ILAANRISYDLYMITEFNKEKNIEIIRRLNNELNYNISEDLAEYSYQPQLLIKDIGEESYNNIQTAIPAFSNIYIKSPSVRFYPYKEIGFHVLGYVSLITEELLKNEKYKEYDPLDYIGHYGIEEIFEGELKGKDGIELDIINAFGKPIYNPEIVDFNEIKQILKRELEKKTVSGNDIYLTIDLELQKKAEELLGDQRGAIIIQETKTGEILAMVSHSTIDGNIFIKGISTDAWSRIKNDPSYPLINRTIQGKYSPGSIFKLILAFAMLDQDLLMTEEKFKPCKGKIELDNVIKYCWREKGHGDVKLQEAIAYSCNIYFYQLGKMLGIDTIEKYAKMFNLDKRTGIILTGEKKGLIPSRNWKRDFFEKPDDKKWWPPETLDLSIGQGFIVLTPLSIATLLSSIANQGKILKPIIVKDIITRNETYESKSQPVIVKTIEISQDNFKTVNQALFEVVNKRKPRWGSGWKAYVKNLEVCGKTGTAQVVKLTEERHSTLGDQSDIPYQFRDHAWFAGFAPFSDPQVTIIVLIEHGGYGGSIAAPIAAELFKECQKLKFIKTNLTLEQEKKDEKDIKKTEPVNPD